MYEAYPLQWPVGYKKTPPGYRIKSQFKQTMSKAQDFLIKEIERLGGYNVVISTNIRIRKSDGGFYHDDLKRKDIEPGVAIYFKHKDSEKSMCCDQYISIWENIYALGKCIEALRGIERWGVSDFLGRAFTGFKALPAVNDAEMWQTLGLQRKPDHAADLHTAYKSKAKQVHPDAGGSAAAWDKLQTPYKNALFQFNIKQ